MSQFTKEYISKKGKEALQSLIESHRDNLNSLKRELSLVDKAPEVLSPSIKTLESDIEMLEYKINQL
jgi:predicted  nucleic acid-binding Zn-ribbon protein